MIDENIYDEFATRKNPPKKEEVKSAFNLSLNEPKRNKFEISHKKKKNKVINPDLNNKKSKVTVQMDNNNNNNNKNNEENSNKKISSLKDVFTNNANNNNNDADFDQNTKEENNNNLNQDNYKDDNEEGNFDNIIDDNYEKAQQDTPPLQQKNTTNKGKNNNKLDKLFEAQDEGGTDFTVIANKCADTKKQKAYISFQEVNQNDAFKTKSKLDALLNNKPIPSEPKKNNPPKQEKKILNYDEEFPELR